MQAGEDDTLDKLVSRLGSVERQTDMVLQDKLASSPILRVPIFPSRKARWIAFDPPSMCGSGLASMLPPLRLAFLLFEVGFHEGTPITGFNSLRGRERLYQANRCGCSARAGGGLSGAFRIHDH